MNIKNGEEVNSRNAEKKAEQKYDPRELPRLCVRMLPHKIRLGASELV